ncbi:hypothetical protein ACRRTK_004643 [Alexandromys fortis]
MKPKEEHSNRDFHRQKYDDVQLCRHRDSTDTCTPLAERNCTGKDLESILRCPTTANGAGSSLYSNISKDRRYADLTEDQRPSCESLKDTIARALPFWNEEIVPQIKEGERVLIAAMATAFGGDCQATGSLSEEAIMELNLPTGIPIVYELDKNLKPVKPMQFLGDEERVRKAMDAVASQGKAKK